MSPKRIYSIDGKCSFAFLITVLTKFTGSSNDIMMPFNFSLSILSIEPLKDALITGNPNSFISLIKFFVPSVFLTLIGYFERFALSFAFVISCFVLLIDS